MFTLSFFYLLIIVLVSVGFFTLMERKVLGYIQVRRGPNKVGVSGLLQPFSDGLSLFMSEFTYPFNSNLFIYILCPFFLLVQSLLIWCMFPTYLNMIGFEFSFLFFLSCSCLSVYGLIICGWSSNSSYSMLGAIRGVSQAVSYEVCLSLILYCYFFLIDSYNFMDLVFFQDLIWFCFSCPPLFLCWVCCCMAETNRTPFDFSEGESELVSGYNVEYSSGSFSVLFISEYSSIIFMSLISCLVFLGGNYSSFLFFLKLVLLCFLFVWTRSCLPRYRYDSLMYLSWSCLLPFSLNQLVFFVLLKLLFIYHFFLLS